MKISSVEYSDFCLRLPIPLETAHGTIRERRGRVVMLRDSDGQLGFGECAPLPGFGLESFAAAKTAIAEAAGTLEGEFETLDAALDRVDARMPGTPCARAALDTALHDLSAKQQQLSLADLLARSEGREARTRVSRSVLLRQPRPDDLAEEIQRAIAGGAGALKLKVGASSDDLARVAAARAACPEMELRLDANAAWTETEARQFLRDLAEFEPSYVEQPVASIAALARLRGETAIPLAVDESLRDLATAEKIARADAADVWVIKPAAVGGLRAARRIAARARAAKAEVVVSGFLDGPVGAAATWALAASLPGERPAGLAPA